MKHTLPKLNYSYEALEPYIDVQTMETHHAMHHRAYLTKMNDILEKYPGLAVQNPEDLLSKYPDLEMDESDKLVFKNNAGGYINHNLYWQIMGPKKEIDQKLVSDIVKEFGSIEDFKKLFTSTAINHFGSGWAFLVKDENDKLKVYNLPNQDSPFSMGHVPILNLDVWEHAYYLKYQNRRPEYIHNWWNVVKII